MSFYKLYINICNILDLYNWFKKIYLLKNLYIVKKKNLTCKFIKK